MRNKKPIRKEDKKYNPSINTPSIAQYSSSLFSNIFQGFSFGTGSAIAHNIFRPFPSIETKTPESDQNKNKESSSTDSTIFIPCDKLYSMYDAICFDKNSSKEEKDCQIIFEKIKNQCL